MAKDIFEDDPLPDAAAPEEVGHGYDLLNNVADAPTIYADGCIFVSQLGDVIRISFAESIVEPSNGPSPGLKTRHVANIVMNREGFNNALLYLNKTLAGWEEAAAKATSDSDAAVD